MYFFVRGDELPFDGTMHTHTFSDSSMNDSFVISRVFHNKTTFTWTKMQAKRLHREEQWGLNLEPEDSGTSYDQLSCFLTKLT